MRFWWLFYFGLTSILSGQLLQPKEPTPAQVCGLQDVVAVAVGGGVGVLAVTNDGTVWECSPQTASRVSELSDVVAVAAGICHDMALKKDGTVWEWPDARVSPEQNRTPSQISGVTDVVSIAAGETRSLAVTRDGTLWEWTGRPAAGCVPGGEEAPRPIEADVVAASVAYEAWMHGLWDSRTVVLKKDGTVWVWHKGEQTYWTSGGTPQKLDGLAGIVSIAAGVAGDVALKEDGTVWQWDNLPMPVQVAGLTDAVAVASAAAGPGWAPQQGGGNYLALKSDGTVWVWSRWGGPPVQIDGLSEVTTIAAAGVYLGTTGIVPVRSAIKRDGTLWYW